MGVGLMVVALAVGVGSQESATRPSETQEPLRVGIALYNRADTEGPFVVQARERVDRILREIGVSVIWRREVLAPADTHAELGIIIQPRILPHRSGPAGELGVAIDAPSERGRLAYVFFERVLATAQKHRVDQASLLGHAIAHEVGHLLLPFGTHADTGLMRAEWDRKDFEAMNGRGLSLNAEQAPAIRVRLLKSSR
jgi:hypothetical protein